MHVRLSVSVSIERLIRRGLFFNTSQLIYAVIKQQTKGIEQNHLDYG